MFWFFIITSWSLRILSFCFNSYFFMPIYSITECVPLIFEITWTMSRDFLSKFVSKLSRYSRNYKIYSCTFSFIHILYEQRSLSALSDETSLFFLFFTLFWIRWITSSVNFNSSERDSIFVFCCSLNYANPFSYWLIRCYNVSYCTLRDFIFCLAVSR